MAGCYDRNWSVGSKARGTRSQFRLESILPFKCTYPAHLADVMDVGQSSQTGLRRPDLVSPVKGTRTRTVREYEQTIDELKKENFDLKLRIFLLEENHLRNKGINNEEQDNTIQVFIELKVENEALRNELSSKSQQLQEALDQVEKYTSDLKDLQAECKRLGVELSSLSELPSKQEFLLLQDESANLEKEVEHLRNLLLQKEKEIEETNSQVEELSSRNKSLENKAKKSSLAIQGLVYKHKKEVESIPVEMRPFIQAAVKAAKESNEEELIAALENFQASLCQMVNNSVGETSLGSRGSDEANTLHLSLESLRSKGSKNSFTDHEKLQKGSCTDINQHITGSSSTTCLPLQSNNAKQTVQTCDSGLTDFNLKSLIRDKEEEIPVLKDILRENEDLKCSITEKLKTIHSLSATCDDLEQKTVQLQSDLDNATSKIRQLEMTPMERKENVVEPSLKLDSSTQTSAAWDLLASNVSDKITLDAGHPSSTDLKEETRLLLLIEQKDMELSNVKQDLAALQAQLENMLNKKEEYFSNADNMGRYELCERLARSCAVNNELMRHLQNLEDFMENLLQQKSFDSSSFENLSETTSFLSQFSREIDESLKLTHVLSDHLSIYESSKVGNDFSMDKDDLNITDKRSYQHSDISRMNLTPRGTYSKPIQGRNTLLPSVSELNKNVAGTGKRRWSLSSQHKAAMDSTVVDSDNVVVLGTSNNEDLILLLDENGDPEDVLIRNSQSHLDPNPLQSNSGDQYRRRCWEDMATVNNLGSMHRWPLNHGVSNVDKVQYTNARQRSLWCLSSDSDIWSEPDRDVSMQRIGIDVKSSPVAPKSPRKLRFKDKRTTEELSSEKNESNCSVTKVQSWSRRRRSSEISKTPCKKCGGQPQQLDGSIEYEKNKNDSLQKIVNDVNDKNETLKKELGELRQIVEEKSKLIESFNIEHQKWLDEITMLKEELIEANKEREAAVLENDLCENRLKEICVKNEDMENIIKGLETKLSDTDVLCDQLKLELNATREKLNFMDSKCSEYEKQLSAESEVKEELVKKLNTMEAEKNKLLDKSEKLIAEKNNIKQKLEFEEEKMQSLEKERNMLNKKVSDSYEEVCALRASNKELEDKKTALLKENQLIQSDLIAVNSLCDKLNKDLKKMQENVARLESQCSSYEKELQLSSDIKEDFMQKMSSLKVQFLSNINKLCEVCKVHLNTKKEIFGSNTFLSTLSDSVNEKQIETLYEDIVSENDRFKQTVDLLEKHLVNVSMTLQESRSVEEKHKSWTYSIQKHLESKEGEINYLKEQNDLLLTTIEKLQLNVGEKENAFKHLDRKLQSLQERVREDDFQLNLKDDEITKLQERIFTLQSQVNSMKAEKLNLDSRQRSPQSLETCLSRDVATSPVYLSGDLLAREIHQKTTEEQTTPIKTGDNVSPMEDNTSPYLISPELSPRSPQGIQSKNDFEKYVKKIKSLQTKLFMSEKRIEILEKEKCDLRDNLLAQVEGKNRMSGSAEELVLNRKVSDLESRLETKSSFIKDLKNDLFKTCNSLVDKQSEVDALKNKLSQCICQHKLETLVKNTSGYMHSDPFQQSNEAMVKELKQQKWDLIQTVLGLQKEFYLIKSIHLGHFEKFRNHIDRLHYLQISPPLIKAESEPLLSSSLSKIHSDLTRSDRNLRKCMVDLELDIECLQNLKVFFKRFLIPRVSQNSYINDDSTHYMNQVPIENKHAYEKSKPVVADTETFQQRNASFDILPVKDISAVGEAIQKSSNFTSSDDNKFVKIVWNISHKLDSMESALKSVKTEIPLAKEIEASVAGTPRKMAAKSLLRKIFNRIDILHESTDDIFLLNSTLKSLDLFANIPKSSSKQDMSDRESLMSDETITLSRSESLSPVSFEETLQIKAASSDTNQKKAKSGLVSSGIENKELLPEFYNRKSATVRSSQDSVCHRSHYSSPDLGIESDPNHESSAPEQMEKEDYCADESKASKRHENGAKGKQKIVVKQQPKGVHTYSESSTRVKDDDISFKIVGTLCAIGILQEYELLKREIQESLVGIKSVLSRTGDGLLQMPKHTSPRKNLEYSTIKAIKDTCENVEVCLKKAYKLIANFRVAQCPTKQELDMLVHQNQDMQEKLRSLQNCMSNQENEFKEAMERLKHAELIKENMERKISKKLVKTKKIIRRAELKLLENKSQNLPLVPKCPTGDSTCQRKA